MSIQGLSNDTWYDINFVLSQDNRKWRAIYCSATNGTNTLFLLRYPEDYDIYDHEELVSAAGKLQSWDALVGLLENKCPGQPFVVLGKTLEEAANDMNFRIAAYTGDWAKFCNHYSVYFEKWARAMRILQNGGIGEEYVLRHGYDEFI